MTEVQRALRGKSTMRRRLPTRVTALVGLLAMIAVACGESGGSNATAPFPHTLSPTTESVDTTLGNPEEGPPIPEGAILVAVFGDSVALGTGVGLSRWMNGPNHNNFFPRDGGEPGVVGTDGATEFGCGLLGPGRINNRGTVEARDEECAQWPQRWAAAADDRQPHLAVVQTGHWEIVDRVLPGDDDFSTIGDPAFDAHVRDQVDAALTIFTSRDIAVIWLLAPHHVIGVEGGVVPDPPYPESDPERIDRFNAIVREVVAAHSGNVAVLDLGAHIEDVVGDEMDTRLRPDLEHFDVDVFEEVLAPTVGEAILALYAEMTGWVQPLPADGDADDAP